AERSSADSSSSSCRTSPMTFPMPPHGRSTGWRCCFACTPCRTASLARSNPGLRAWRNGRPRKGGRPSGRTTGEERHDCSSGDLQPDKPQCRLTGSGRIEKTEEGFKKDSGGNNVTKTEDLVGTIG